MIPSENKMDQNKIYIFQNAVNGKIVPFKKTKWIDMLVMEKCIVLYITKYLMCNT